MKNRNWKDPKVNEQLKYIIEHPNNNKDGKVSREIAATYFKVSRNAINIAYNRYCKNKSTNQPKKDKKSTISKLLKFNDTKISKESNPFEIINTPLPIRSSFNSSYVEPLYSQIQKLDPKIKTQAVNIPITVCPDKNAALSLYRHVKRHSQIAITIRIITSSDNKKSYLGARIYRLN